MCGVPIQISCLDVAQPFRFTRSQNNHIRRDEFIIFESTDISNADVSPRFDDKVSTTVQYFRLSRVEFCVTLMTLDVLLGFLECRGGQDET